MTKEDILMELERVKMVNDSLQTAIDELRKSNANEFLNPATHDNEAILYQSSPDASKDFAVIYYSVNVNLRVTVSVLLYNRKGEEVRRYEGLPTGLYALRVDTNDLKEGLYIYQLNISGHVVDNKMMIISK